MASVTGDLLRTYAESDGLALGALVRSGEVTPAELVEAALAVIERDNSKTERGDPPP